MLYHRHVTERTAALGSNHLKVQMILQGLNNGKLNMAKQLIEHDDKRSSKVAGYRLSYYLSHWTVSKVKTDNLHKFTLNYFVCCTRFVLFKFFLGSNLFIARLSQTRTNEGVLVLCGEPVPSSHLSQQHWIFWLVFFYCRLYFLLCLWN